MKHPISSAVRRELAIVEDKLREEIASAVDRIAEPTLLAMEAGGKRLRPALVVLSAMVGNYDRDRVAWAAMAVELVHLASLIHDDVLDGARTRRGEATVNARFGLKTALAAGDYLFGLAFQILARYGNNEVIKPLARASLSLSLGELLQKETARDPDQGTDTYLRKVEHKTAALFSAACEIGAIVGGVDADARPALADYGCNLGLAFQIYDDILDITGDESLLGKRTGTDFREGTVTLPVLYALEKNGGSRLRILVEAPSLSEAQVAKALEMIDQEAIARAKSMARCYVKRAVEALAVVPNTPVRRDLAGLGHFVVDRYN